MPPKKAAKADVVKDEEVVSESTDDKTVQGKKAQNKRLAMLKGKRDSPGPIEQSGDNMIIDPKKVDPLRIMKQVFTNPLESPMMDSDSLSSLHLDTTDSLSLSQLSPGIPMNRLSIQNGSFDDEAGVRTVHQAVTGATDFGGLQSALQGAEQFLSSSFVNDISRDKCTLNTSYRRDKSVFGTNMLNHVLTREEDLSLLRGTYSQAELVLLSSSSFPLDSMYHRAVSSIRKRRIQNEDVDAIDFDAPTINNCLAWLARAGQCSITSLLPRGEFYPDAENYLKLRLVSSSQLPLAPSSINNLKWTVYQITRTLTLLSVCNLRPLHIDDRCNLLFAVATIFLDCVSDDDLKDAAHALCRNILSSCDTPNDLIEPLFNLTPTLTSEPSEVQRWIACLKATGCAHTELLLAIGSSYFIHTSERAECTPDSFFIDNDPYETKRVYMSILADTMLDVFAQYNQLRHKRNHRSTFTLLNECLTMDALRVCEEKTRSKFIQSATAIKTTLRLDRPDDAIILTQLRSFIRRVEKQSGRTVDRRTSNQIGQLLYEKNRVDQEAKARTREIRANKAAARRKAQEKTPSDSMDTVESMETETTVDTVPLKKENTVESASSSIPAPIPEEDDAEMAETVPDIFGDL